MKVCFSTATLVFKMGLSLILCFAFATNCLAATKKTGCEGQLETKPLSRTAKRLAALPLFERIARLQTLLDNRHDYVYMLELSYAFSGAWQEWFSGLRAELAEDPTSEKAWNHGHYFHSLQFFQQSFESAADQLRKPAAERAPIGTLNLNQLKQLYDDSSPLAQATIIGIVLWQAPQAAQPFVDKWLLDFESGDAKKREDLIQLLRKGSFASPQMLQTIERHFDSLSLASDALIAKDLLSSGRSYNSSLLWKSVVKVLSGNDPRLIPSALSSFALRFDTLSLDPSENGLVALMQPYVENAPTNLDSLIAPWLSKIDDHRVLHSLISNLAILKTWSPETELTVAGKLREWQSDPNSEMTTLSLTVLQALAAREKLRNPVAAMQVSMALKQRDDSRQSLWLNHFQPILDDLAKKY